MVIIRSRRSFRIFTQSIPGSLYIRTVILIYYTYAFELHSYYNEHEVVSTVINASCHFLHLEDIIS